MKDEEIRETVANHTGGDAEMFREGYKRFWRKNMLTPKDGAKEDGCPPGTTRSDTPRSLIYDVDDPVNKCPKFAFWKPKPEDLDSK